MNWIKDNLLIVFIILSIDCIIGYFMNSIFLIPMKLVFWTYFVCILLGVANYQAENLETPFGEYKGTISLYLSCIIPLYSFIYTIISI